MLVHPLRPHICSCILYSSFPWLCSECADQTSLGDLNIAALDSWKHFSPPPSGSLKRPKTEDKQKSPHLEHASCSSKAQFSFWRQTFSPFPVCIALFQALNSRGWCLLRTQIKGEVDFYTNRLPVLGLRRNVGLKHFLVRPHLYKVYV